MKSSSLVRCLPNVGGRVLGCIKVDLCNKIFIFAALSRSTRFATLRTAQISKSQQKFFQLLRISIQISAKRVPFQRFSLKFARILI